MGFFSYWNIPGVSPEAREAALRAANAEGLEVGAWLSDVIQRISAEEIAALQEAPRAADAVGVKMSSIERAMMRSRAGDLSGDFGRA